MEDEKKTLFPGLCFGPFLHTEPGTALSDGSIRHLLQTLQGKTTWIRTYGSSGDLKKIPKIAHELGFKVAAGAHLDKNAHQNQNELHDLAENVKNGWVDLAVVGNEVLLRKDLPEDDLIHHIKKFKETLSHTHSKVQVTTAEPLDILKAHPKVLEAVDAVMVNLHPYWAGLSLDHALDFLKRWHQEAKDLTHGKKRVLVGETGWPTEGPKKGDCEPSGRNAHDYAAAVAAWASEHKIPLFYFEAFDEKWKKENGVGPHWGIWDCDSKVKGAFAELVKKHH